MLRETGAGEYAMPFPMLPGAHAATWVLRTATADRERVPSHARTFSPWRHGDFRRDRNMIVPVLNAAPHLTGQLAARDPARRAAGVPPASAVRG